MAAHINITWHISLATLGVCKLLPINTFQYVINGVPALVSYSLIVNLEVYVTIRHLSVGDTHFAYAPPPLPRCTQQVGRSAYVRVYFRTRRSDLPVVLSKSKNRNFS